MREEDIHMNNYSNHFSLLKKASKLCAVALLLAFMLTISTNGKAADYYQIKAPVTNSYYSDMTTDSIYEKEEDRAKLTVLLAVDLCGALNNSSLANEILSYPSYVGLRDISDDNTFLNIIFQTRFKMISMLYCKADSGYYCDYEIIDCGNSSGDSDSSKSNSTTQIDLTGFATKLKEKTISNFLDLNKSYYENDSAAMEAAIDEILINKQ